MSRADLTRATGLNRSTVGVLVGTLVELGYVVESHPRDPRQIGRPSPLVSPSPSTVALAINPEIDAVTVGIVRMGGEVVRKIRFPTQQVPTALEVANIAAAIIDGMRDELDRDFRVVGIGVAVPGLTRVEDGVVSYAPHLGWRDEPIVALISAATGYPAAAANDASLGAGAELQFGGGQGCNDLVYLNGGASGVGGGFAGGGALRTGRNGFAGELGHTLVRSDGDPCHCGGSGCLETEVSLARLEALVGLHGVDLEEVEQALKDADPQVVLPEVRRQLGYLAITLRNAVNAFNPERIILGGFLSTLFSLDPTFLIEQVQSRALHGPGEAVEISRAVLGPNILMIGAAELAFAPILADPLGGSST